MNNINTKVEPRFNYTQHSWEGNKYRKNEGLYGASLAKAIRQELKEKLPQCKLSVTKETYSGGQSINVHLMEAPFNPFNELNEETMEKIKINCQHFYGSNWEQMLEKSIENFKNTTIRDKHHQVNNYYVKDDTCLTEEAKSVINLALNIINSYNFDDSDSQIDYFHTNFYTYMSIGKWDKPFQIK